MPIVTTEPTTIWSGKDGEYTLFSPLGIVDTTGKALQDTSGNSIVDTGVLFTGTPATVWTPNDAI